MILWTHVVVAFGLVLGLKDDFPGDATSELT